MDARELFNQAVKAYQRHCKRNGYMFDMPDESASNVEETRVYLRSVRGVLAVYAIKGGRISEPEQTPGVDTR